MLGGCSVLLAALAPDSPMSILFTIFLACVSETTLKGKQITWHDSLTTQLNASRDPVHLVDETIIIAGQSFPTKVSSGQLELATNPMSDLVTTVASDSDVLLSWLESGITRSVRLHFVLDDRGIWRYYAANGWEYTIGGNLLRLVDVNTDGLYDELSIDGCTLYDSSVMLPLRREFVIGASRVRVMSIAKDGSELAAIIEPINEHPSKVAALSRLNRWRASHGLCSVDFDPILSRNCTAHAEYLRLNMWTGNTDPHSQEAGAVGSTPEGQMAARRSIIWRGSVVTSIDAFASSYYHRIPLMNPALNRVGVNEMPDDITVIDVAEGFEQPWPSNEGWSCPVISPAPGSRRVPIAAKREYPHEPVDDFGSRGFPVMLLFDPHGTRVVDFKGMLFKQSGPDREAVATLVADPWSYPFVCGIVPSDKLSADSRYVGEFTFTIDGARSSKVISFETK